MNSMVSLKPRLPYEREIIESVLPHRAPFLWLQRILALEPGQRCVAESCLADDHPIFSGHFPGSPVVPGVLMIEMMAQTACFLIAGNPQEERLNVLSKVNEFNFIRPVAPNDVITIDVSLDRVIASFAFIKGYIRCGNEVAAKGEIVVSSLAKDVMKTEGAKKTRGHAQ